MRRAVVLASTLYLIAWAEAGAQRPPEPSAPPPLGGRGYEPGGSNYQAFYLTPAYLTSDNPGAEISKAHAVEMVVGNYHVDSLTVGKQLREMYQRGQRKVSLPLHFIRAEQMADICRWWLTQARCDDPAFAYEGDETWNTHMLVHTTGPGDWRFSTRVYSNLKAVAQRIAATGFNELQIRFLVQDPGIKPTECASWYDPSTPQGLWGLERSVMDTVNHALQGSRVNVMYDLGAEFAAYQREGGNSDRLGCGDGRDRTAMIYLWRKYVCRATPEEGGDGWPFTNWTSDSAIVHTVGFTFGNRVRRHGPSELYNQVIVDQAITVFDYALQRDSANPAAGYRCGRYHRPAVYAFDLYPGGGADNWGLDGCQGSCLDHELFDELGKQLAQIGSYYQPIALWEVPVNSKLMKKALVYAARDACFNIRTVMQWPAFWKGTQEPMYGKPPQVVHWTSGATPDYIYFLPKCKSR